MKASGSINQHHVGTVRLGTLQGIEGHAGRVRTHLLLHHWHPYSLAPNADLFHGSGTEGIGSTEIHLLASLLKLIGELSYGGSLAHTIHTHYQNHVWLMIGRQIPVFIVISMIFLQEACNLFPQDSVEF